MNRASLFLAATLLAFSGTVLAGQTPGVDNAYSVTGDPQAAPVQAFSVGNSLYVQLRNVHLVPAPIGPSGPIPYRIFGPYMVLPLMQQVTLHYGAWTAYVTAAGVPAQQAVASSSMTTPVDALHPSYEPSPSPPTPAPAPFVPWTAPVATTTARPSDQVVGQISVPGEVGTPASDPPPSSGNAISAPIDGTNPGQLLDRVPGLHSGITTIHADGTVSGARFAEKVMQACIDRQAACRIQYAGAQPGTVSIEVTQ